eukprot:5530846-Pleurochrysis_carterae.AAC.1
MHRMFNSVAKLHLVTAACCLTIMLIHTYWIHGSRVLGLAESANPTLVTHASRVNRTPISDAILLVSARTAFLVPRVRRTTARRIIAWDERLNDKAVEALCAAPGLLIAGLLQTIDWSLSPFAPTTSPPSANAAPRAPTQRPRVMSTPLATSARVMLASDARRIAPRRSRRLPCGKRSIGFVVDSGCTWHIHPHMSDLVNVKTCHDQVAGINGKPQRCIAIGDLPVTAMNDSGNEVSVKNVRCVPSFSDSLLSVSAPWESLCTECRFANVKRCPYASASARGTN